MRYYAIILIPTEINYQNSMVSVMKTLGEIFNAGYEIFYSLEPFTLKVKETVMQDVNKWFRRCFGVNTFIIPIVDENDLDYMFETSERHGINIAYTYERLWIKGRKLKTYCINALENVPLEIMNMLISMGFNVCRNEKYPAIMGFEDLLLFSKKPEVRIEDYAISKTKVYVESVRTLKPWHTLTYGVEFNEVYKDLVNVEEELYEVNNNIFLEKLVIVNDKYPILTLNVQDDTILLYTKGLRENIYFEKLLSNILAYISSDYVKLHL